MNMWFCWYVFRSFFYENVCLCKLDVKIGYVAADKSGVSNNRNIREYDKSHGNINDYNEKSVNNWIFTDKTIGTLLARNVQY